MRRHHRNIGRPIPARHHVLQHGGLAVCLAVGAGVLAAAAAPLLLGAGVAACAFVFGAKSLSALDIRPI